MSKFTQGKWEYDGDGYIWAENKQMMVAQIRGWGHLTGKGAGGLGLSEQEATAIQEANERLIAAAPEMYRLLRVFAVETSEGEGSIDELFLAVLKARKLLARIDGKEANDA